MPCSLSFPGPGQELSHGLCLSLSFPFWDGSLWRSPEGAHTWAAPATPSCRSCPFSTSRWARIPGGALLRGGVSVHLQGLLCGPGQWSQNLGPGRPPRARALVSSPALYPNRERHLGGRGLQRKACNEETCRAWSPSLLAVTLTWGRGGTWSLRAWPPLPGGPPSLLPNSFLAPGLTRSQHPQGAPQQPLWRSQRRQTPISNGMGGSLG